MLAASEGSAGRRFEIFEGFKKSEINTHTSVPAGDDGGRKKRPKRGEKEKI